MARVAQLCRYRSLRCLLDRRFVGGAHVSISPWGPYLYHPMVSAWRLPLVSLGLWCNADHAVCGSPPRRHARGGDLVVCQQSPFPLVRCDRPRHGILHDSEGDWTPRLQLSLGSNWLLDLRVLRQLDRAATLGRRTVSGIDDHFKYCGDDLHSHSSCDGWSKSSYDDARVFRVASLQPHASLYGFRSNCLHRF